MVNPVVEAETPKQRFVRDRALIEDAIKSYYVDKNTADIIFRTRDGGCVYGHKSLLTGISELFKNLFQEEACCKCQGKNCNVKTREALTIHVDCEEEILKLLMEFLYTGSIVVPKPKIKKCLEVFKLLGMTDIRYDIKQQPVPSQRPKNRGPKSMRETSGAKTSNGALLPPPGSATAASSPRVTPPTASSSPKVAPSITEPKISKSTVLNAQMEMTKMFAKGAQSLQCKVEGCTETVDKKSFTPHISYHLKKFRIKQENVVPRIDTTPAPPTTAPPLQKEISSTPPSISASTQPQPGSSTTVERCAPPPGGLSTSEATIRAQEANVRAQEASVRAQEVNVRTQEATVSSQEPTARAQEASVRGLIMDDLSSESDSESDSDEEMDTSNAEAMHTNSHHIKPVQNDRSSTETRKSRPFVGPASRRPGPASMKRKDVSPPSSPSPESLMRKKMKTMEKECLHQPPRVLPESPLVPKQPPRLSPQLPRAASPQPPIVSGQPPRLSPQPSTSSKASARSSSPTRPASRSSLTSSTRSSPSPSPKRKPGPASKTVKDAPEKSFQARKSSRSPVKAVHTPKPQPQTSSSICSPLKPKKLSTSRTKPSKHKLSHEQMLDRREDGVNKEKKWRGLDKPFNCLLCDMRYKEFRELRTHYTLQHFWEELEEMLKDTEDVCTICRKRYPSHDHLIQHMGNFHSYVDKCLSNRDPPLPILNEETTVHAFARKCQLCHKEVDNSSNMKSHMAQKHFKEELTREFGLINRNGIPVTKCPKCGEKTKSINFAHIGSFHDEVLKYTVEYGDKKNILELSEEDLDYVPRDDFDDDPIVLPYQDPKELEGKSQDVYSCGKCSLKFTRGKLKIHYLESHYLTEAGVQFPSQTCIACDEQFKDLFSVHKHIVTQHEQLFIDNILEKDGITLPPSHSPKKSSKLSVSNVSIYLDPFNIGICQICQLKIPSVDELKKHYVTHFFSEENLQTSSCTDCSMQYGNVKESLNHRAVAHSDIFLIPEMEKRGLWTNAPYSIQLEDINVEKAKNVKLKVENYKTPSVDINNISQKSKQQENKTRADEVVSLVCDQDNCSYKADTDAQLKLHLLKEHLYDDLSNKYKSQYQQDKSHCPICKVEVSKYGTLKSYLEHLATQHDACSVLLTDNQQQAQLSEEQPQQSAAETTSGSREGGASSSRQVASKSTGGILKVRTPDTINKLGKN